MEHRAQVLLTSQLPGPRILGALRGQLGLWDLAPRPRQVRSVEKGQPPWPRYPA